MWLWIVATFAAFFVKGLCGFANTLVFTSILGFGTNNIDISPIELLVGYPTNLILTWQNRKQLNPRVYIPLSVLVLAGIIPGAFLLKNVNAEAIKVVFGFVVVFIGLEMLSREMTKHTVKESKAVLGVIGFLSGLLCGLFGIGALLAAYVSRVTSTNDEFKANISAVFIVENTFRIVLYSVLGIITLSTLKYAALLMPFMLIGLFAGIKSSKMLNEKIVKKLVIILLILSGVILIIKNI